MARAAPLLSLFFSPSLPLCTERHPQRAVLCIVAGSWRAGLSLPKRRRRTRYRSPKRPVSWGANGGGCRATTARGRRRRGEEHEREGRHLAQRGRGRRQLPGCLPSRGRGRARATPGPDDPSVGRLFSPRQGLYVRAARWGGRRATCGRFGLWSIHVAYRTGIHPHAIGGFPSALAWVAGSLAAGQEASFCLMEKRSPTLPLRSRPWSFSPRRTCEGAARTPRACHYAQKDGCVKRFCAGRQARRQGGAEKGKRCEVGR